MDAATWALNPPGATDVAHVITVRTLASSPTSYRIPVGSCNQWRGYSDGAPLILSTPDGQVINAVRLLP
jgi:hypothetical protein